MGTTWQLVCNAHFGDADNNPATGCEANLLTDTRNCGAVGNVASLPTAVAAYGVERLLAEARPDLRVVAVAAGVVACALLPWNGAAGVLAAEPPVNFSGPWVLNLEQSDHPRQVGFG